MTIAFEASGALTTGTATSIELPLPTNVAGELLMAFGMAGVDAATEGPTLDINESGYGNQYVHDKTGGTDSTGIVESKFSTGGETTALTLQITPGTALALKGQVFAVSGVHADVWDATPVSGTGIQDNVGNGDGAGTYKTPAITTATANAVVLSFIHKEGGGTSSAVTPPSGYTLLVDPAAQDGVNPIFGVAYKLVASPGTETPGSWSGWGGVAADISGFTLALKAAVKYLKLLVHADAQGDTAIAGVVFEEPPGGDITGAKIGEFAGAAFEASLEGGKAVLKVPVDDFGGAGLTTSDAPVALVLNATDSTGIIAGTVIEE